METPLLDFSNIQRQLDKLFSEIPDDIQLELSDLKLKNSNLSSDSLSQVESKLKISLPNIFKKMTIKYDFGDLTLGEVWFGSKVNYAEYLIKLNARQIKDQEKKIYFVSWWGADERPKNYIMIGASDGYIVLLNTATEEILAYSRTESHESAEVVASDFENFVRAIATVYILVQNEVVDKTLTKIPSVIGSNINNGFWREIIRA